jgi:hypothetical protein
MVVWSAKRLATASGPTELLNGMRPQRKVASLMRMRTDVYFSAADGYQRRWSMAENAPRLSAQSSHA